MHILSPTAHLESAEGETKACGQTGLTVCSPELKTALNLQDQLPINAFFFFFLFFFFGGGGAGRNQTCKLGEFISKPNSSEDEGI